jgi:hypothetical protein
MFCASCFTFHISPIVSCLLFTVLCFHLLFCILTCYLAMLLFCAPICYCATILHSHFLPCYLAFPPYIRHINASHSNLLLCSYLELPSLTTLLFHAPYLLLICTPHLLLFHNPRLLLHVSHYYQVLPRPLVIAHFSFATILHSWPIVTFGSQPIVLHFSFKMFVVVFSPLVVSWPTTYLVHQLVLPTHLLYL